MSSSSRRFRRRTPATESVAEKTFRLSSEAECRRIADVVAGMLPASRGFVLVTADYGDAGAFSNTNYVARMRRDDAARLLTEMLDTWRVNGAAEVTEPSVQTATFLRESVHGMTDVPTSTIATALPETVAKLRTALGAGGSAHGSESALALSGRLAVEALSIFDRLMRAALREPDPEAH